MNSPLTYVGGKHFARGVVIAHSPPHGFYAEPFAGSASIFFAKTPVPSALNDMDEGLMNCLRMIRDDLESMDACLPESPDRTVFERLRDESPDCPAEAAARYWYLNRCCYGGMMAVPRWSSTKTQAGYDAARARLPSQSERLRHATLTEGDFADCIEALPDRAFCYVDPPYMGGRHGTRFANPKEYYRHAFDPDPEAEHRRLRDTLERHRGRLSILLSINDCAEARALYDGWHAAPARWQYFGRRTEHTPDAPPGRELLVASYRLDTDRAQPDLVGYGQGRTA